MATADSARPAPEVYPGASERPDTVTHTGLRKGSIGLAGVLMQSIAQISPTLGIFYTIAFNTGQAGRAAPLTYLAAFAICLVIAVPRGFITGWLYALMVTVVPAALAAFTGAVLHDELDAKYGFGLPWWAYALVILAICFACAYRGIVISVRFLVVMSMFEIAVGLGLSLSGVASPGPGGVNGAGFNPAHIGSSSGFFLAIVLSIFAFTGFESAAAVGEESRNPKRLIPIAIAGSLTLIGAFYVFCAWGLQTGWGTDKLSTLASSPTAPAFVLADRLWSGGSIIVLIALVNSGLGVCIACTTSSTRTIFGMARTGALPAPLARVSTRFGTPVTAVLMQTAVAVAVALAVGLPLGPYNLFNLLGTTGTFVYIPIFILMNVAAFKFFRDKHRDEFRILPLVVAPVVSTVALITIGYKSIVPLPAAPVAFAPALAAGYLLLGVLVLFGRNLRPGRRGWMVHAGELPDVG